MCQRVEYPKVKEYYDNQYMCLRVFEMKKYLNIFWHCCLI